VSSAVQRSDLKNMQCLFRNPFFFREPNSVVNSFFVLIGLLKDAWSKTRFPIRVEKSLYGLLAFLSVQQLSLIVRSGSFKVFGKIGNMDFRDSSTGLSGAWFKAQNATRAYHGESLEDGLRTDLLHTVNAAHFEMLVIERSRNCRELSLTHKPIGRGLARASCRAACRVLLWFLHSLMAS